MVNHFNSRSSHLPMFILLSDLLLHSLFNIILFVEKPGVSLRITFIPAAVGQVLSLYYSVLELFNWVRFPQATATSSACYMLCFEYA